MMAQVKSKEILKLIKRCLLTKLLLIPNKNLLIWYNSRMSTMSKIASDKRAWKIRYAIYSPIVSHQLESSNRLWITWILKKEKEVKEIILIPLFMSL